MLAYRTGEAVHVGDRIFWDGGRYLVVEVIDPGTEQSEGYRCFDEGGILTVPLKFDDYFLFDLNDDLICFDHRGAIDDNPEVKNW